MQGKGKDAPDHHYLHDALTALLENQKFKVPATKVAGCLIDRVDLKPVGAGEVAPDPGGRSRGREFAGGA